jgi:AraC-like DNA-binding protein
MLTQSYLTLQTSRLKPSEKWTCEGDDLYLLFPDLGGGTLTAYSTTLKFSAGDMIAISGRSAAKLAVADDSQEKELVIRWFAVSLDSLFPLFAPGEVCFLQNVTQEFRSPRVYLKTNALVGNCRQMMGEVAAKLDLIHRSQLLRIIAFVLSSELKFWQQKQTGTGESTDDHMLRIFEQLSSHELLNLSVEELADKFGCSRRHLSRLFHQRFGLSVATLRMEMRLLKASSLLRDPSVKVINVAEQCGFNHLGLFNTCFKRRFGLTPGVWRNTLHEKEQATESTGADSSACPLEITGLCPMLSKSPKDLLKFDDSESSERSSSSKPSTARASSALAGVLTAAKANRAAKPTDSPISRVRPNGGHPKN